MTSENQEILRVNHLVKHFSISKNFFGSVLEKVHAVDGVSFSLKKGEVLGLVGESGCGKSTLGRTLAKLYEPTGGKILFNGTDITSFSDKQMRPIRKHLQMIFQDPYGSLNPRMNIGQILAEPFDIQNLYEKPAQRAEVVQHLMEEVGLNPSFVERFPHEFSGGQRQRIGIARALALHPQLIICDEPVSALDVSIQSQILNLLLDLRDKYRLSYLFIAHDLAVIEHMSDHVAVMYLGKIVECTSSQNIYRSPKHPYTQALISSIPKQDQVGKRKRVVLQGDLPSPVHPPSGCRFHTRCPMAQQICKELPPDMENKGTVQNPHFVACHFS